MVLPAGEQLGNSMSCARSAPPNGSCCRRARDSRSVSRLSGSCVVQIPSRMLSRSLAARTGALGRHSQASSYVRSRDNDFAVVSISLGRSKHSAGDHSVLLLRASDLSSVGSLQRTQWSKGARVNAGQANASCLAVVYGGRPSCTLVVFRYTRRKCVPSQCTAIGPPGAT